MTRQGESTPVAARLLLAAPCLCPAHVGAFQWWAITLRASRIGTGASVMGTPHRLELLPYRQGARVVPAELALNDFCQGCRQWMLR